MGKHSESDQVTGYGLYRGFLKEQSPAFEPGFVV
jgi:hypothetical protein